SLPFTQEGLELLILRMRALGRRRRGLFSKELGAAHELGGKLFEALFSGEIRTSLRSSLVAAQALDGVGLRVRLRLQNADELANLPWEYLYDESLDQFLAQSDYTPLVRYIEMPSGMRRWPLHLLFESSSWRRVRMTRTMRRW